MAFLDLNGLERLWSKILLKFDSKVDKIEGKNLSTNDFTDDYKTKIDAMVGDIGGLATEEFVTGAIDDIEIGGRNLLLNTNQGILGWTFSKSGEVDYTFDTEAIEDGTLAVKLITNTDPPSWAMLTYGLGQTLQKLEPNTDYVLSFDLKTNTDVAFSCSLVRTNATGQLNATDNLWYDPIANESWEHVEWHFTTNSLESIGEAGQPDQVIYFNVQDGVGYRTIKDLKLEKGNKATGWSSAPEDWSGTVKYTTAQNLSEARKAQARANIGAMSADTVIPSLSGYATETYVNNAVSSKSNIGHTHNADSITGNGYLVTHPEYSSTIIPFIHNDLAFLDKKGGSCSYYETTDTNFTSLELTKNEGSFSVTSEYNVFDGSPSYTYLHVAEDTTIIIDLTLHRVFDFSNKFYIDFGNDWWKVDNIAVYVMNSDNETSYTFKNSINGNAKSHWYCDLTHEGVKTDGSSYYGYDKIRIVLSGYHGNLNPRISEIGLINYGSQGVANTFVSRGGCDGMYGDLIPYTNNNINLGSSSKKWNNIYTDKINDKGTVTSSDSTPIEIVLRATEPTELIGIGKTIIWIDTSALS